MSFSYNSFRNDFQISDQLRGIIDPASVECSKVQLVTDLPNGNKVGFKKKTDNVLQAKMAISEAFNLKATLDNRAQNQMFFTDQQLVLEHRYKLNDGILKTNWAVVSTLQDEPSKRSLLLRSSISLRTGLPFLRTYVPYPMRAILGVNFKKGLESGQKL